MYLIITIVVLIFLYIIFFWRWKKNPQTFYYDNDLLSFGHRGSPTYITENTIPSFEKAIEQGVDGIEFDIRLTKDNKIVIFHDEDLKRLNGERRKIKNLTYTQLQHLKLKKTKTQNHESFIPLLNDVIPLLNKLKVINIEIKSEGVFKGHKIIKPLLRFLEKNQIDNKCIISSFNPLILWKIKIKRPQTVIGFLYNRNAPFHALLNMELMIYCRPDNLHIHHTLLDSWIVRWAKNKRMKINSYTINDKKAYNKAKEQRIDGIFTDNIEYLK